MFQRKSVDKVAMGIWRPLNKNNGMSLIEIMIATGIMGILMMVMTTMQTNQLRSNNFLQFQLHRTQLQGTIIGQFLSDPNNCKCLFAGANSFPATGTTLLTGVSPTQIGRYNFATAGDCSTATIPNPFITNTTNSDGVLLNSIQMRDIQIIGGQYSGNLFLDVSTTKNVMGPDRIPIKIPVAITAAPSGGGSVSLASCQAAATSRPRCRVVLDTWDNDNCTGGHKVNYTTWSNDVPLGTVAWNVGSIGNPGNRTGMNWHGGDIACMRAGIQCE